MSSTNDVANYLQFVVGIVKECGQLFLKSKDEDIEIENKTTYDIVTKYDKNIERLLVTKIKEKYPNHRFIGEEDTETKTTKPELTNDPTWIIDPVDGTTNFSKKIPFCGISVGLTINKEQVLGIIYLPYFDELFTAVKEPKKALLSYEIGVASRNSTLYNLIMSRLGHLVKEALAVRCLGCPVVSLCYVASGQLDAYLGDGLYPWDAAAGTLIVKEAGGYVIDSSGEKFDLMNPNFLATATETLGKNYVEILKKADQERRNNI